ncbi:PKD domain-containing protein [Candidatus Nomurabacteria bacterium]|nr:PKD domain-containing protein [Candidatus Nomurabacteria bacterium]
MRKIFSISVLLVSLLFNVSFVNGQEVIENEEYGPQVYVTDVVTSQDSYSAGDSLEGVLTVKNASDVSVNNITFVKSLTGDYESGLAGIFYLSIIDESSFNLLPKEEKEIPFSLILPDNISGALGIQIELISDSGLPMTWGDAFFTVVGENYFASVADAKILKGEENFDLDTGTEFFEGEQPVLFLVLDNTDSERVLELVPNFSFSKYPDTEVFEKYQEEIIRLQPGEKKEVRFDLPTFGNQAGVYQGIVDFTTDLGGNIVPATPVDFRYTIDGDIASVQSLLFDKYEIQKGQEFTLTVGLSGKPLSLSNPEDVNVLEDVVLLVDVTNEKGRIIGQYQENLSVLGNGELKDIKFISQGSARYPLATVQILKDGEVIAELKSELPEGFDFGSRYAMLNNRLLEIGLGILVIIFLVIIVTQIRKKKDTIPVVVLLLGILIGGTLIIDSKTIEAQSSCTDDFCYEQTLKTNRCSNNQGEFVSCSSGPAICSAMRSSRGESSRYNCHYVAPRVDINYANYTPGEDFFLTGNVIYTACSNSSPSKFIYQKNSDGSLTLKENLNTTRASIKYKDSRKHWYKGNKQFSIELHAPNSCGPHAIDLRFVNCVNAGHTKCGFTEGTVTLNISSDDCEVDLLRDPDDGHGSSFSCRPSKNPVKTNEEVTFSTRVPSSYSNLQYEWDNGDDESTSDRTYATEGIYTARVKITGENSDGDNVDRTVSCGLTVSDIDFNASPPRPRITELNVDSPLTNDQCIVDFRAENVSFCDCIDLNAKEAVRFLDGNSRNPDIPYPSSLQYEGEDYQIVKETDQTVGEYLDSISGTGELGGAYAINPSRYVIQCFNSELQSSAGTPFQCVGNLDFREQ